MTVLDELRDELVAVGLVRAPEQPGVGARPWLPICWRHPDDGAVGPGDAKDQRKADVNHDDGLVVSLMYAPGIPPPVGAEERRIDGINIVFRGRVVQAIADLEAAIRVVLLGNPPNPGGRTDWIMGGAGGVYVIQSRQWSPFQPLRTGDGVFTFTVGYTFETRAT